MTAPSFSPPHRMRLSGSGTLQIRNPTKKEQGLYGCSAASRLGSDAETSSVLYAGTGRPPWEPGLPGFRAVTNTRAEVLRARGAAEPPVGRGLKRRCLSRPQSQTFSPRRLGRESENLHF